jgi:hypothetical protein
VHSYRVMCRKKRRARANVVSVKRQDVQYVQLAMQKYPPSAISDP